MVVNGPRQSGKTALLGMLRDQVGGTFSSFDDPTQLELARRDPTGFVTGLERPHFIDEVQRGGEGVLLAVKRDVDQSRRPGQFVLAGSTRFLSEPRLSDSLAGRVRIVDLWPLSQGEITGTSDGFVDSCFDAPESLATLLDGLQPLTKPEIFDQVVTGGFPEAVLAPSAGARRSFLESYLRTVTRRDIRELAQIRLAADLPRMTQMLLGRTASELNLASLSSDLRMTEDTVRRYIALLETVYLVHLLPAWSRNVSNRQRRRPKFHAVDTGLAAVAQRVTADRLARPDSVTAGGMLETFVVNEVVKQLSWHDEPIEAYHWREDQGREVDLVLERADGAIVAIEVKAGIDIRSDDVRGLNVLRDRLGDDFVVGVVVHCGARVVPLGDRMIGVPVSALWHTMGGS